MALLSPPASQPTAQAAEASRDPAVIDAQLLAVFADRTLQSQVRELPKMELAQVWLLTREALEQQRLEANEPIESIQVHHQLLKGLAGETLLVASSMVFRTLSEAEAFFDLSFKTIKSRLGGSLDTAASERALRAARATLTAAEVHGSYDAARAWMHTPNFALGGAIPADLVKTADGERLVLNELQAQAECGPL